MEGARAVQGEGHICQWRDDQVEGEEDQVIGLCQVRRPSSDDQQSLRRNSKAAATSHPYSGSSLRSQAGGAQPLPKTIIPALTLFMPPIVAVCPKS